MAEDSDPEEAIVKFVKRLTLAEQRADPKSKFRTIAVEMETKPNSGVIAGQEGKKIMNGCFFISVYDALCYAGCDPTTGTPHEVLSRSGYRDLGRVVDTKNPYHAQTIKTVAADTVCTIVVHSGRRLGPGKWLVNPDEFCERFGSDELVIRLVNDASHFEALLEPESKFVPDSDDMTLEQARELQLEAERHFRDIPAEIQEIKLADVDPPVPVSVPVQPKPLVIRAKTTPDKRPSGFQLESATHSSSPVRVGCRSGVCTRGTSGGVRVIGTKR